MVDKLEDEGITKFILIGENVLNFHSGDKDYYNEWFEEVTDEDGWIVIVNMPEATQHDFKKRKLNYFIELMNIPNGGLLNLSICLLKSMTISVNGLD